MDRQYQPPGLLLLVCQQAADEAEARESPMAPALSGHSRPAPPPPWTRCPHASRFSGQQALISAPHWNTGQAGCVIRLRLDDLAWFSTQAAGAIPLLRTAIATHHADVPLREAKACYSAIPLLHAATTFVGHRSMLRILGDPLPSYRIMPGSHHPLRRPTSRDRWQRS